MADETTGVYVRMPARLKKKIAADAFKQEANMTSVIVTILAGRYGVPYTPSNRRSMPFGGGRKK